MDRARSARALGASDATRRAIVRANWGTDELPYLLPTSVTKFYAGTSYHTSFPVTAPRADLLVCPLPRGGVSNAHLIYPASPIGRVVILHAGHNDHYYSSFGTTNMEAMATAIINAGYHLVGMQMPLGNFNPNPLVLDKLAGGTMSLGSHDAFATAEADGVKTLRLFVDPVIAAVNYVVKELQPLSIDMTGLSGGGWTTDWCAALMRRIRRSVPVFGSMPFSLRPPGDIGDFEQSSSRPFWAPLAGPLGGEEMLYALGGTGCVAGTYPTEPVGRLALGGPRRRVQILGTMDPVFPAATVLSQIASYNAAIQRLVGGSAKADIDIDAVTPTHAMSATNVAKVMSVLAA